MEEILKELMSRKCVAMHDSNYRCYGKKCEGQCPMFYATIMQLKGMSKEEAMGSYTIRIVPEQTVDCGTIVTKCK